MNEQSNKDAAVAAIQRGETVLYRAHIKGTVADRRHVNVIDCLIEGAGWAPTTP